MCQEILGDNWETFTNDGSLHCHLTEHSVSYIKKYQHNHKNVVIGSIVREIGKVGLRRFRHNNQVKSAGCRKIWGSVTLIHWEDWGLDLAKGMEPKRGRSQRFDQWSSQEAWSAKLEGNMRRRVSPGKKQVVVPVSSSCCKISIWSYLQEVLDIEEIFLSSYTYSSANNNRTRDTLDSTLSVRGRHSDNSIRAGQADVKWIWSGWGGAQRLSSRIDHRPMEC